MTILAWKWKFWNFSEFSLIWCDTYDMNNKQCSSCNEKVDWGLELSPLISYLLLWTLVSLIFYFSSLKILSKDSASPMQHRFLITICTFQSKLLKLKNAKYMYMSSLKSSIIMDLLVPCSLPFSHCGRPCSRPWPSCLVSNHLR